MKKTLKIILVIAVLLITVRILLPYIVKDYVNQVLNDMEGYQGQVDDVNLNLYRGAYVIKGVEIEKESEQDTIPFLDIGEIDLSVEWGALFDGAVVGEVYLINPTLNFVDEKGEEEEQVEDSTDWVETIKDLIPLRINRFEIANGKISFKNPTSSPPVDIAIENLRLVASNISNVESKDQKLPSSIRLTGTSIGGGSINLDMKGNFLKQIPDIDGDLSFENVALTAFNDFTKAYGNFDLESGTLSLYTEAVINDGQLEGYIKPIFENVELVDREDRKENTFFQNVWEGLVGLFSEAIENQPRDQAATRIPISGNLENPQTHTLDMIFNIFENAFIEAFEKQVEGTVSLGDDAQENAESGK